MRTIKRSALRTSIKSQDKCELTHSPLSTFPPATALYLYFFEGPSLSVVYLKLFSRKINAPPFPHSCNTPLVEPPLHLISFTSNHLHTKPPLHLIAWPQPRHHHLAISTYKNPSSPLQLPSLQILPLVSLSSPLTFFANTYQWPSHASSIPSQSLGFLCGFRSRISLPQSERLSQLRTMVRFSPLHVFEKLSLAYYGRPSVRWSKL